MLPTDPVGREPTPPVAVREGRVRWPGAWTPTHRGQLTDAEIARWPLRSAGCTARGRPLGHLVRPSALRSRLTAPGRLGRVRRFRLRARPGARTHSELRLSRRVGEPERSDARCGLPQRLHLRSDGHPLARGRCIARAGTAHHYRGLLRWQGGACLRRARLRAGGVERDLGGAAALAVAGHSIQRHLFRFTHETERGAEVRTKRTAIPGIRERLWSVGGR